MRSFRRSVVSAHTQSAVACGLGHIALLCRMIVVAAPGKMNNGSVGIYGPKNELLSTLYIAVSPQATCRCVWFLGQS